MLDPSGMYPNGFHPIKINRTKDFKGNAPRYDRTLRPPRYYLVGFGMSRKYSSRNALDRPLRGGDKSAPEHQDGSLSNPFCTDIYYLGNLICERFLKVLLLIVGCLLNSYDLSEVLRLGIYGGVGGRNDGRRPSKASLYRRGC